MQSPHSLRTPASSSTASDSRPRAALFERRASGILLHPTSLPGPFGAGDLGPAARELVDWLARAGQSVWQLLPLGPPDPLGSPYQALSVFAGSPSLISPEDLAAQGLLEAAQLSSEHQPQGSICDLESAARLREKMLRRAFESFEQQREPALARDFAAFCAEQCVWLPDWTRFAYLRKAHEGAAWSSWPGKQKRRKKKYLRELEREAQDELRFHAFVQFVFETQWQALRTYAGERGVRVLGDLPIFPAADSAEVWARPELFRLNRLGRPARVAGTPPDDFNPNGQRWGLPVYAWEAHRAEDWSFWIQRFRQALERFDAIRIDHFIGFVRTWSVPARRGDAQRGRYEAGPGANLFQAAEQALGPLPFVAENLGDVGPDVEELRSAFDFPGMRVLQFGLGGWPGPHDLKHHQPRDLVYSGTHDTDTLRGWFENLRGKGDAPSKRYLRNLLGAKKNAEVPGALLRLTLSSIARTAILPLQDVLGLDASARMNRPGSAYGQWRWRLEPGQLDEASAQRLAAWTRTYGRAASFRKDSERAPVDRPGSLAVS